MKMIKDYEMVIGLEVHVELKTKTKIFCNCKTDFGAAPNTQCCPVCMGMPGTLPVLNKKVVEYAVKAGLATNCQIASFSKQDRKNYFYPDLPKAYQISQYDLPLCEHGWLDIESDEGTKRVGITRIHIEEDAGKLVHDDELGTLIDCNRCGVPLIEIVSEPDLRSAEDAVAYLKKLRAIILYTGISDCKMNEGSLRCDVNLSVRKKGTDKFGTRTEMKNLNSFAFIAKAIEYEYKRQVDAIEAGEEVIQETRRYDPTSGKTYQMRSKENANDYRYFPDPDLPGIVLSNDRINEIKSSIPSLPDERKYQYVSEYGLSPYDAEIIVSELFIASFFEEAAKHTGHRKILANLLISELPRLVSQDSECVPADPALFAEVAEMLGEGDINSSTAKKVLKEVISSNADPRKYVTENGLMQINDDDILKKAASDAISENPKMVSDYIAGKSAAFKSLMGQCMQKTGGKGNPVKLTAFLEKELSDIRRE